MSVAHQTETYTPCFDWMIEAAGRCGYFTAVKYPQKKRPVRLPFGLSCSL